MQFRPRRGTSLSWGSNTIISLWGQNYLDPSLSTTCSNTLLIKRSLALWSFVMYFSFFVPSSSVNFRRRIASNPTRTKLEILPSVILYVVATITFCSHRDSAWYALQPQRQPTLWFSKLCSTTSRWLEPDVTIALWKLSLYAQVLQVIGVFQRHFFAQYYHRCIAGAAMISTWGKDFVWGVAVACKSQPSELLKSFQMIFLTKLLYRFVNTAHSYFSFCCTEAIQDIFLQL